MNLHKTEVEILHSAYHHLWQQMLRVHLFQRLHRSGEQAHRVKREKSAHKHVVSSL